MGRAGMLEKHFHLLDEIRGHLVHTQAEKIFDLRAEYDDGNPAGKTGCDRVGNVFDHRTELRQRHDDQHDAGHDCADDQVR